MLLRIARKQDIAEGIVLFDLRDPNGADLPEFSPGAHVLVKTPSGFDRNYSLCGDPSDVSRYEIAIKLERHGRGGSSSMIEATKEGDLIEVGPPINAFPLVPSPAGYIFIAGGIGVTPIMSMVRSLASIGAPRFKLYYLTRNRQTAAFHDELSAPMFRGKVEFHHDDGDLERTFDLWPLFERPNGMHVYCCGPRGLMDGVRDMTGHWPAKALHFEAFGDAATKRPDDAAFDLTLARSGKSIRVSATDSILQAVRAAGCEALSSCESGTCGACKTRLIEGVADHRDLVLSESERGCWIMPCVSRARSSHLVLDL